MSELATSIKKSSYEAIKPKLAGQNRKIMDAIEWFEQKGILVTAHRLDDYFNPDKNHIEIPLTSIRRSLTNLVKYQWINETGKTKERCGVDNTVYSINLQLF